MVHQLSILIYDNLQVHIYNVLEFSRIQIGFIYFWRTISNFKRSLNLITLKRNVIWWNHEVYFPSILNIINAKIYFLDF